MNDTQSEVFTDSVRLLLMEAFEGAHEQRPWFSDSAPEAGLFATLAALSPETASRPVTAGGTTIAAHAEHLRWSLALTNALARGETPDDEWAESWSLRTVNSNTWRQLQTDLRSEYQTLISALPPTPDLTNPIFVTSGVALVAHAAYHLSAIRQMALVLRGRAAA